MTALISLLSVVALSILIVRIATSALVRTGMSEEAARFQARSTLSGTGFTTREAEQVVQHPVRRRIILLLMTLQNAGVVTAVSALILSFVGTETTRVFLERVLLLALGLGLLMYLANSQWINQYLGRLITWALNRYTRLEVIDYYTLLNINEEYSVGRIRVRSGNWLANKRLDELQLPEEGALVLSIIRADGSFVGVPRGQYKINVGDTLTVYGKSSGLAELNQRVTGEQGQSARLQAEENYQRVLREQDQQQQAYQRGR